MAALEKLLSDSASGDESAFGSLYDIVAPQLFGLALRILKRRDWAEDVLQEALLSAWRHSADYRPDLGSAKTWLTVILRNRALDRLRREAPARLTDGEDAALEIPDPGPSALDLAISGDSGRRLTHCMGTLEESQRQVITMAYFEGLTHEQLASRLGSPLGTVKSWVRRGLQRLKSCLTVAETP